MAQKNKMAPQKDEVAAGKKARPAGKPEGALRRAEHRVEEVLKDVVAEVENRVMLAGEAADESTSSEVNILSALEVAVHPPHSDDKPPAAGKVKKKP
jgi:hypothetical protein